jgi:hypothetical protein
MLLPGPDGRRIDAEQFSKAIHAESSSLAEVADQPTQIGGFRGPPGVVTEESDHCRQCPETGGDGSGLAVVDGRFVDAGSRRNIPLENSEVQATLSKMVAD